MTYLKVRMSHGSYIGDWIHVYIPANLCIETLKVIYYNNDPVLCDRGAVGMGDWVEVAESPLKAAFHDEARFNRIAVFDKMP